MTNITSTDLGEMYNEMLEEIRHFASHVPFREGDDTAVILKSHLLIEMELVAYVAHYLVKPQRIEKFTFDQYLRLADALNGLSQYDWIFAACRNLNQIRNKISHQLAPLDLERAIVEFIDFVHSQKIYAFTVETSGCNRPEFRGGALGHLLGLEEFEPKSLPSSYSHS